MSPSVCSYHDCNNRLSSGDFHDECLIHRECVEESQLRPCIFCKHTFDGIQNLESFHPINNVWTNTILKLKKKRRKINGDNNIWANPEDENYFTLHYRETLKTVERTNDESSFQTDMQENDSSLAEKEILKTMERTNDESRFQTNMQENDRSLAEKKSSESKKCREINCINRISPEDVHPECSIHRSCFTNGKLTPCFYCERIFKNMQQNIDSIHPLNNLWNSIILKLKKKRRKHYGDDNIWNSWEDEELFTLPNQKINKSSFSDQKSVDLSFNIMNAQPSSIEHVDAGYNAQEDDEEERIRFEIMQLENEMKEIEQARLDNSKVLEPSFLDSMNVSNTLADTEGLPPNVINVNEPRQSFHNMNNGRALFDQPSTRSNELIDEEEERIRFEIMQLDKEMEEIQGGLLDNSKVLETSFPDAKNKLNKLNNEESLKQETIDVKKLDNSHSSTDISKTLRSPSITLGEQSNELHSNSIEKKNSQSVKDFVKPLNIAQARNLRCCYKKCDQPIMVGDPHEHCMAHRTCFQDFKIQPCKFCLEFFTKVELSSKGMIPNNLWNKYLKKAKKTRQKAYGDDKIFVNEEDEKKFSCTIRFSKVCIESDCKRYIIEGDMHSFCIMHRDCLDEYNQIDPCEHCVETFRNACENENIHSTRNIWTHLIKTVEDFRMRNFNDTRIWKFPEDEGFFDIEDRSLCLPYEPRKPEGCEDSNKYLRLYIGGLIHLGATAADYKKYFEQFGEIIHVYLVEEMTGVRRIFDYGFVTCANHLIALKTIGHGSHKINGKEIPIVRLRSSYMDFKIRLQDDPTLVDHHSFRCADENCNTFVTHSEMHSLCWLHRPCLSKDYQITPCDECKKLYNLAFHSGKNFSRTSNPFLHYLDRIRKKRVQKCYDHDIWINKEDKEQYEVGSSHTMSGSSKLCTYGDCKFEVEEGDFHDECTKHRACFRNCYFVPCDLCEKSFRTLLGCQKMIDPFDNFWTRIINKMEMIRCCRFKEMNIWKTKGEEERFTLPISVSKLRCKTKDCKMVLMLKDSHLNCLKHRPCIDESFQLTPCADCVTTFVSVSRQENVCHLNNIWHYTLMKIEKLRKENFDSDEIWKCPEDEEFFDLEDPMNAYTYNLVETEVTKPDKEDGENEAPKKTNILERYTKFVQTRLIEITSEGGDPNKFDFKKEWMEKNGATQEDLRSESEKLEDKKTRKKRQRDARKERKKIEKETKEANKPPPKPENIKKDYSKLTFPPSKVLSLLSGFVEQLSFLWRPIKELSEECKNLLNNGKNPMILFEDSYNVILLQVALDMMFNAISEDEDSPANIAIATCLEALQELLTEIDEPFDSTESAKVVETQKLPTRVVNLMQLSTEDGLATEKFKHQSAVGRKNRKMLFTKGYAGKGNLDNSRNQDFNQGYRQNFSGPLKDRLQKSNKRDRPIKERIEKSANREEKPNIPIWDFQVNQSNKTDESGSPFSSFTLPSSLAPSKPLVNESSINLSTGRKHQISPWDRGNEKSHFNAKKRPYDSESYSSNKKYQRKQYNDSSPNGEYRQPQSSSKQLEANLTSTVASAIKIPTNLDPKFFQNMDPKEKASLVGYLAKLEGTISSLEKKKSSKILDNRRIHNRSPLDGVRVHGVPEQNREIFNVSEHKTSRQKFTQERDFSSLGARRDDLSKGEPAACHSVLPEKLLSKIKLMDPAEQAKLTSFLAMKNLG